MSRTWSLKRLINEHRGFLLFVVLMIAFRSAIADWNAVPTGSMNPTIVEGDRIFVDKLAYDVRIPLTSISLYKLGNPQRGDIVVFNSEAADKRMVKRIIGLPGDTIALRNNMLIINGESLRYTHQRPQRGHLQYEEHLDSVRHAIQVDVFEPGPMNHFGPVSVPQDHYFVMGDNRDHSADSRYYGFVPRTEIVGRAKGIILSLDYENYYLPRDDRYLQSLQ